MEAKSLGMVRFGEVGYTLVKVLAMNVMRFLMVAVSSRWGLAPC